MKWILIRYYPPNDKIHISGKSPHFLKICREKPYTPMTFDELQNDIYVFKIMNMSV